MGFKRFLIYICCTSTSFLSIAQDGSNLGIGLELGYKSAFGQGGLMLDYKVKKRLDFYVGSGMEYTSYSFVSGFNGYFLKSRIQPFVGINYCYYFSSGEIPMGSRELMGRYYNPSGSNDPKSYYKVTDRQFAQVSVGGRLIMDTEHGLFPEYFTLNLYVSYRCLLPDENIVFTQGVYSPDRENRLKNYTGGGLGIGIRFIYYPNRRRTT